MTKIKVTNREIATILHEIADLLRLRGSAFKPAAYRKAARSIESMVEDINDLYERGELEDIPGVGKSIGEKIRAFIEKGELSYLDDLRSELPAGISELMEIEGIGPKTALRLHNELGILGAEDLEKAAKEHEVRKISGFGEKSELNILNNIELWKKRQSRFLLGYILHTAESFEKILIDHDAVSIAVVAGSIRRRKETIGDIDILVSTRDSATVSEFFCSLPGVKRVVMKGLKRCTVVLAQNLHMDMRMIEKEKFGAALQYFTGSKAHNIRLRKRAIERGFKLNEYGLIKRDSREVIASRSEEEIYDALGLVYIPPELREDRGEIEAAEQAALPDLIACKNLRGDLHMHTKWSDGANTIREMAETAARMGYEYIAITDHSGGLHIAHGLSDEDIIKQGKEIERLNREFDEITILHGIEANINNSGSPDVSRRILSDLDFAIGSIHSGFRQSEKEMTERIVTAMHNGNVDMIGHPTGRLLRKREPYQVDLDEVFSVAKSSGVLLEINAFPTRLDLTDINCCRAGEFGVMLGIGTDAHNMVHLRFMDLGVAVARRGWLKPSDVINTRSLKDFTRWLDKKS